MDEKRSWSKDAEFRQKNRKWLKYSSNIARRILSAIDKKDSSQVELARLLDVTPQQINKIVKGRENLTLETIANISTALGVELISFPPYEDDFIMLGNQMSASYKSIEPIPKFVVIKMKESEKVA